jgi:hypothetical protein
MVADGGIIVVWPGAAGRETLPSGKPGQRHLDSAKNQSVSQPPTDSHDARQPQRKIFSPPDAPLDVLRAENALVARVNRRLRQVLGELGGRALTEFTFRYAMIHGDLAALDALASYWFGSLPARDRRAPR